jgi:hypothetical protein
LLHTSDRTTAFGVNVCNTICIGGTTVAEDFSKNRCTTASGVLIFFEDDDCRPFPKHKSIAIAINWTTYVYSVSTNQVVEAALGYRHGAWSYTLRGRNHLDQTYTDTAIYGGVLQRLADPRSFELSARARF